MLVSQPKIQSYMNRIQIGLRSTFSVSMKAALPYENTSKGMNSLSIWYPLNVTIDFG